MNMPLPAAIAAPAVPGIPTPNWNEIRNALATLGQEVPLIANVLPQNQLNAIVEGANTGFSHIDATLVTIVNALNGVNNTLNGMTNNLDEINKQLALVPIRNRNTSNSLGAPVVYPVGTVAHPAMPITKLEAFAVNGTTAATVLAHLGVPGNTIPTGEAARIEMFKEYLGIY